MNLAAPLGLIAELTHRCPLRCAYCSNPVELERRAAELDGAGWRRVIDEAADLGVLQIYFTGGEPCLRPELPELTRAAHDRGLYTNLVTSGVGLGPKLFHRLMDEGLDHVQLSLQDIDRGGAVGICGVDALAKKKEAAALVRDSRAAFTINIVVHRRNLARLGGMIDFAADLGAAKIEIAHVQFNGWALKNKAALLPTEAEARASIDTLGLAREKYRGRVRLDYVLPDYYARTPKACMSGWARQMMLIDPAGRALPCHSATIIPNVEFPRVTDASLGEIWRDSRLFNLFRGTAWMPEACRGCARRDQDFGGCRCQALAFTGDAAQMDPVCHRSPFRDRIDDAIRAAAAAPTPLEHRPVSITR